MPENCGVDDRVFWQEVCRGIAVEIIWVIKVGHREAWSLGIVDNVHILFVEESVLRYVG